MVATDKKNLPDLLADSFSRQGLDQQPGRKKAMEMLHAIGLPAGKSEEYRFTPVTRMLEAVPSFEPPVYILPSSPLQLFTGRKCHVIAFINGVYSAEYSNVGDSISIHTTEPGEPAQGADPFDLLNHVFTDKVVEIAIPDHKAIDEPLAIVYYNDRPANSITHPRWVCRLGEGGKATLLEYSIYTLENSCFTNKQSLIEVGKNASLDYVTIQQGTRGEVLVNNAIVKLADSAQASCYTCTFGGKLVRNNLSLVLDGEGIDAHLHGFYLAGQDSQIDNHTVVDHRKPNSFSNELYKGVLDGNGKAVFNGKIFVRPDAQKTNAFQSNRNILLSENSTIHTKPQLEIWADDVKCSHGCTTGQLDEEALFYLRSRGIPKDMARGLLLDAFASETLEGVSDEAVRTFVDSLIQKRLQYVQGL